MEKELSHNLKKIQRLIDRGWLNTNDFYSITIKDHGITLQGKYNSDTIKKYAPKPYIDNSGYLVYKKYNFDFTFTS